MVIRISYGIASNSCNNSFNLSLLRKLLKEMMLILINLFIFIAAGSKAVMDIVSHRFHNSAFRNLDPFYWDPVFSWRNKYKNRNPDYGPKFLGSTTLFSFTTDAWHLFQSVNLTALWIAFGLVAIKYGSCGFWYVFILLFSLRVVYGVVFEILYSKILSRK